MNKNFKNINDEELDKLFKDAADRFQPPDAPHGAWDDFFKNKMFQEEKITPSKKYSALRSWIATLFFPKLSWQFATVCFIAIASAVWFLVKDKSSHNPAVATIKKNNKIAGVADSVGSSSDHNIVPINTDSIPEPVWDNIPAPVMGYTFKMPTNNGSETEVNGSLAHDETNSPYSFAPQSKPGFKNTPADSSVIAKKQNFLLQPQTPSDRKPTGYNWYAQSISNNNRNAGNSNWQLGVLGGSNLGIVKGDVSAKPGVNAGVMVQRKIGRSRFSVESGVVYESMAYDVRNEDFMPNGQPASTKVSNIEGTCSMIDIPINVRYNMIQSKKNKAFISTGVSPTVIVKQSYIYDYAGDEGTVQINRDVSGKGKDVYAVANISIGYEQKWNHVSVQIAPYVKIPMGEIGYGNLSLGGVGTQISIKKDL